MLSSTQIFRYGQMFEPPLKSTRFGVANTKTLSATKYGRKLEQTMFGQQFRIFQALKTSTIWA